MQHFCSTVVMLTVSLLLSLTVFLVAAESSDGGGVEGMDSLISSLHVDEKDMDSESVHNRVERQAEPAPTPKLTAEDLNLADDVSEDYPVVFNIMLFLAITLILALIAISVAISTMDPGRDSLIYRVTSAQRFKKDN